MDAAMIILLRIMAIVATAVGVIRVALGLVDPHKSAIDILALIVLWTCVAVVMWSQASVHQRSAP